MRELKVHKSVRGLWVFIDGKHKKTIPYRYESVIEKGILNLSTDRKYLNETEKELLNKLLFAEALQGFLDEIKEKEKHLFRLIKDVAPVGVRRVFSRHGQNRFELCLENKLKVKIPAKVYYKFPVKEPDIYLNY